jgi:hypothetical protein
VKLMPTLEQHSADRLGYLLKRIERETKQDVAGVLKQAAIWSLQSAAKVTEPGKSAFKRLGDKYKFKPMAKWGEIDGGKFWYVRKGTGKMFSTPKPIKKGKAMKGLRRAKGIKSWSKKKKRFVVAPTADMKRDKSDPKYRIPHAGAAKAGWQRALSAFGQPDDVPNKDLSGYYYDRKSGTTRKRKSRKPYYKKSGSTYDFFIQNLVKYTGKTSPLSAKLAMLKTTRRLEGYWLKKLDRKLQQRSNG